MSVITKKTKCPLCGARNEAGARRCQICTRPLTSDPLVTTAIYEEALWSRPVANAHRRAEIRPGVVAVLVIVAALATNYVWLGYGPDWAHLPRVVEKGSDWKSYRSNPAYRADFPGDPIIETANGPTGAATGVGVGRCGVARGVRRHDALHRRASARPRVAACRARGRKRHRPGRRALLRR
ncbi:MAG: hypothetical protein IPG46_11635 [Actinobacteria bacterium]|nr:hypothetical protein [Actinomycetota bacterium]